ncbi:G-protein coupled receptor 157-like isoform X2 [Mercenaria mercenaria]|nr:G-protein coupled receptor 157-like isoform X2 [Mercenaria mercenaria]XP_053379236.1 G-protein coupled receptor 157-like isoform X2 [Mercenaria mercenaria]
MLLEYTDEKYKHEKQTCIFQSMITSFAPCSSFFWTVFIAIYFQVQVLKPSWADKMSSKASSVVYHVLSWGIPGVICVLALYYNVFGDTEEIYTGPWCWIKTSQSRKHALVWMLLTVKGWELLSYLILAEVLVFVVFKKYILPRCLRRHRRPYTELFDQGINISTRLRREDKNFVYVWLIFYVLRFGGTFRFLMHAIHGPLIDHFMVRTARVMMVWQAFGDTAQAFGNFIFLCVCDKTIRQHYLCRTATDRNTGHVTEDENINEAETSSLQT